MSLPVPPNAPAPLVADVLFSTEGLVIIGALMTCLTGGMAYVFKLLQDNNTARLADKDRELALQREETNNWKQIGGEAVVNLRRAANQKRAATGLPPLADLANVVPEHSSEPTDKQENTAALQTTRAALVEATLDLGLPARADNPESELRPTPPPVSEIAAKAADVAMGAVSVANELAKHPPKEGEADAKQK